MIRLLSCFCLVTACGLVGAKDPPEAMTDAKFVMMAANGGMFEVKSSEAAMKMGSDEHVKMFAGHMIKDHMKAKMELKALATKKGLSVPAMMDEKHAGMVDMLKAKSGKEFDAAYMKAQVDAHKKTVALFKSEVDAGQDADLKAWASSTLPTLQKHLDHAEEMCKKMDK